jgi:hypothetical protein
LGNSAETRILRIAEKRENRKELMPAEIHPMFPICQPKSLGAGREDVHADRPVGVRFESRTAAMTPRGFLLRLVTGVPFPSGQAPG